MEALLKALGDRTRLRLLALLETGEVCVCHLHESLALPQPTVSRHLGHLRRAGLVETRRDGLWVHYRRADPAHPVLRALVDAIVHGTSHLSTTRRDRRRLERATGGCCTPSLDAPRPGCCG